MFSEIKNFPVFWKNGMKVSSGDFIEQGNFIKDWIRDARALVSTKSFGILPGTGINSYDNLKLYLDKNQNPPTLYLKECRGVTPGGYRVEIIEKNYNEVLKPDGMFPSKKIKEEKQQYIVVSVNPFHLEEEDQVGAGNNLDRGPIRKQFTISKYDLELSVGLPHELNANQLIVGKLIMNGTNLELDEKYIPPCTSIYSHKDLTDNLGQFAIKIVKILETGIQAQKNLRKYAEGNPLARDILVLTEKIIEYLAGTYTEYTILVTEKAPGATISAFINFAQYVKIQRNFLVNEEEFINKYSVCKESGHDFFTAIEKLISFCIIDEEKPLEMAKPIHFYLRDYLLEIHIFLDTLICKFEDYKTETFLSDPYEGLGGDRRHNR